MRETCNCARCNRVIPEDMARTTAPFSFHSRTWRRQEDGNSRLENMFVEEGATLCPECFDEVFTMCEHCGSVALRNDMTMVYTPLHSDRPWSRSTEEQEWCPHCVDEGLNNGELFQCEDCDDIFTSNFAHEDMENTCVFCFDDHYDYCADCGGIYNTDDLYYDEETDERYCETCYRDRRAVENRNANGRILDYGYKPDADFFKTPGDSEDNKLFFGCELEIDEGSESVFGDDTRACIKELHEASPVLYMKHDGSLSCDGIEIVTHPCTLTYHMESGLWEDVSRIALSHKYRSHSTNTCGLHIHVSRKALGASATARTKVCNKLNLLLWHLRAEVVNFTRRKDEQLRRWAKFPDLSAIANITEFKSYTEDELLAAAKSCDNGDRYRALNLVNTNTIEFRIFRGTLNVETIKANIQFVNNLVSYAMNHSANECVECTIEDIYKEQEFEELKNYMLKRRLIRVVDSQFGEDVVPAEPEEETEE